MNIIKITKAREKLIAKQAAALAEIEAQIKYAEQMERGKVRVERLIIRAVSKQPTLYLADPTRLELLLQKALEGITVELNCN